MVKFISYKEFTYDAYGNPTKRKISGNLVDAAEETFVYDATKRFVTTITAASAGLPTRTSSFTHNLWGNVITQTGYDGLSVTNIYDSWNRLQKVTYSDGRVEDFGIDWDGSNGNYKTWAKATGQAQVTTKFDAAGRERETETMGAKNNIIKTVNAYNTTNGQLNTVTASVGGQTTSTTTYTYYTDGRVKDETVHGVKTTYTYDKLKLTVNHNNANTIQTYDGWGNIKQVTDRGGYTVVYKYHSSGQPRLITAAGVNFEMKYDNAGNQTELIDPSAGTIKYSLYDGLGRVRKQEDANSKIETATYNAYGLLTETKLGTVVTKYDYNNTKGWLENVKDQTTNHAISYFYDIHGRITNETLTIAGEGSFVTSYTYNTNGSIATVTYPGGITEKRTYDANIGNLDKVEVGSTVVWQLNSVSATQTETKLAGGTITAKATYNAQGYLTNLNTVKGSTTIRNMNYVFNTTTGNLTSRTGMMASQENFAYDNLYRLTSVSGGNTMSINYGAGADNGKGNIYNKTGLGQYTYGSTNPYAVTKVASNTGSVLQQDIKYSDFNRAEKITQGNYVLDITYGPDRQRVKTVLKNNNTPIKTVIFAGNYERITKNDTITHLYYITGGGIYVKQTKGSVTLKDGMYYTHTDHLGSLAIITDATGAIKQRTTFDAWGKRTFTTKDPTLVFDRGFTGHEHLDEFELINMNARLYDPVLGRMLSPDNYVQNPLYSQNYNRYSYTINNPLKYTDPSGNKYLFDPPIYYDWDWNGGSNGGGGGNGGRFVVYDYNSGKYVFSGGIRGSSGTGGYGSTSYSYSYSRQGYYDNYGNEVSFDVVVNWLHATNAFASPNYAAIRHVETALGASYNHNTGVFSGQYFYPGTFVNSTGNNTVGITLEHDMATVAFSFSFAATGRQSGRDFSLAAMYLHFQIGGGKDMYIRGSSLDFSNTSQQQLGIDGRKVNEVIYDVNLFNAGWNHPIALAFGRVDMRYLGNNQFNIIGGTRFDFKPFWDPGASLGRNIGNVLGLAVNYNIFSPSPLYIGVPLIFGGPYPVHIQGPVYIPY